MNNEYNYYEREREHERKTNEVNAVKKPSFDKNIAAEYFTEKADFLAEKAESGELSKEETDMQKRLAYLLGRIKRDSSTDILTAFKMVKEFFEPSKKPVEALKKPGLKKPSSGTADKAAKADEPKKPTAAPAEKKPAVETVPGTTSRGADSMPIAVMFPKELTIADRGTFRAAYDKYTTYEEVLVALEAGKTLYFMCFWTKRHIKEFDYEGSRLVKVPKEGFPDDLDIVEIAIPCTSVKRLWGVSLYTEALFKFEADAFEYVEDTDPEVRVIKSFVSA